MPIRRRACRFILLFMAGLAASCATQPPALKGNWPTHQRQVAALQDWQFSGRVGIRYRDDALSATLNWQQQGESYVLRLIAPLGRGTFELKGSPAGVSLQTAANTVTRAPTPDGLLRDALGWELPVDGLVWWVRGLPRPGGSGHRLQLDDSGRLQRLEQDGWTISYAGYRSDDGVDLPVRLNLESDGLQVRLAINRWQHP